MADGRIDALVVGAGPVGLTMAAELHRHGVRCRIIDKSEMRSQTSKALAIWPRTLEMLDDMGIVERFVAAGLRAAGGRVIAGSRQLVQLHFDDLPTPFSFLLLLTQDQSERLLEERLAELGMAVERRTEMRAFARTGDGVSVRIRRADGAEERVDCSWLIGCDGAHSTVRHQLGMEFVGSAEPNEWMLADVYVDGDLAPDQMSLFLHAAGLLTFFPIGGGRFRIIADFGPARAAEPPPAPTLADVQRMIDARGPGGVTARDPIWLTNFRINERKVADYRSGRAFLAGDAAHIHAPAGGQGMNTGMQDAYNLAWKLALVQHGRGRAEPLLDSYSAERSPVAAMVLRNAAAMLRVGTLRSPTAQRVRNLIMPIVTSFHAVQATIRSTLSELDINYRSGPLSRESRPRPAAIRAGDRAHDARLEDGRLFDVMRGTRHVLLLIHPDQPAGLAAIAAAAERAYPEVLTSRVTASAEPREQYAVTQPTAVVIRPDGYVGYIGEPASAEGVLGYLASYLVAA